MGTPTWMINRVLYTSIKTKREVDFIIRIYHCPWQEGYAIVKYKDKNIQNAVIGQECVMESKPIKIKERKDGSKYIIFDGKRHDIDFV